MQRNIISIVLRCVQVFFLFTGLHLIVRSFYLLYFSFFFFSLREENFNSQYQRTEKFPINHLKLETNIIKNSIQFLFYFLSIKINIAQHQPKISYICAGIISRLNLTWFSQLVFILSASNQIKSLQFIYWDLIKGKSSGQNQFSKIK